MKKDIDFGRLAGDLRRAAETLDRLSRRTTTVESLIIGALETLGPLSAYKLVKVTRRGRARVYEALRALEASNRITRGREGYRLASASGSISTTSTPSDSTTDAGSLPPVDPQNREPRENREPERP